MLRSSLTTWLFCVIRLHLGDEQLRDRLLLALPKKGRLYEHCVTLLERCGIKVGTRPEATVRDAHCSKLMKPETATLILSMEWVNNHFRLEKGTVKALLHCAICSATCNATLKNVFVAVSEVGCYTVQCNLSNLQRFVPRKPCDIRYWRAGVGGRSDLQRNRRTLGENCVASCRRGVTLCNGSCKLLRLLQKVELDSTSCNVARNKK